MCKILCIAAFMLFIFESYAQSPEWTDYNKRKELFPDNQYLTGFSTELVKNPENIDKILQKHIDFARRQLVESIKVTIKTTATLNLENLNTETLEDFRQASVSYSEASLSGVKAESYYDKKKKEAYAIAYVKKYDVTTSCKNNLASKSALLKQKIDEANQYASTGELEKSLKAFYSCYPLLREMEENYALIVALGRETQQVSFSDYEVQVSKGISELRKGKQLGLDDACFLMADGLKRQVSPSDIKGSISVGTFTFQDTRMASNFSSRFAAVFEQKLTREGFPVLSKESLKQGEKSAEKTEYSITGTYWDEGDFLKMIANLKENNSGRSIASVEESLSKASLAQGKIEYLPENYLAALNRQKDLSRNEITGGGLVVDVWTNKGSENTLFSKGDTMRLFVKVNQPCYIRFIYYLADGRKTLLFDSRYVDNDKVNKPYLIPMEFICDAPFGAETLQLIAQTEPFKPLNTTNRDGYDFILDDMNGILANVRGMKRIDDRQLFAEKRLDITTVE